MPLRTLLAMGLLSALLATRAEAAPVIGQAAPAFTLTDSNGKTHSLSSFKGRFVVLEWVNPDCPFVGKHYGSGNLQRLQKAYTAREVAWLVINSAAPGGEGHTTATQANALIAENGVAATAVLLDADSKVARAYAARTTPHMFVIDKAGTLIYQGALDDKPSTDAADVATARNYVQAALDAALAGRPVETPSTQAYGSAVKYATP